MVPGITIAIGTVATAHTGIRSTGFTAIPANIVLK
jgi:hypothetical protein